MDARDFYSQKVTWAADPNVQARTLDPIRKHDADGIGEQSLLRGQISEAASLALELVDDLCSPDAYGHAVPVEVVKRAGRIRAMLKPKVCEIPTGIGYQEPPPARCQHCDES